jgi:hypothetical protein
MTMPGIVAPGMNDCGCSRERDEDGNGTLVIRAESSRFVPNRARPSCLTFRLTFR